MRTVACRLPFLHTVHYLHTWLSGLSVAHPFSLSLSLSLSLLRYIPPSLSHLHLSPFFLLSYLSHSLFPHFSSPLSLSFSLSPSLFSLFPFSAILPNVSEHYMKT